MSVPVNLNDRRPAAGVPAFALGLGLTNECNLDCAFCYRDASRVDRLSLEQVRSVMQRLPVRSVNLGTGDDHDHQRLLRGPHRGRRSCSFRDIEFSRDYPSEAEQVRQRGAGNWQLLQEQAARCRRLGLSVTFIAVMVQSNYDSLADVAAIAKAYDAPLRSNVYQSVQTDKFALTYAQYWAGFERPTAPTSSPSASRSSGRPPDCRR